VYLSIDGRWALSGSEDQTMRLWEVASGQCLHTFTGHTDSVTSVSLSADGRFALSGSRDKTVRLWELDWELEARELTDWDEGARSYLEIFLTQHTSYASAALLKGNENKNVERIRLGWLSRPICFVNRFKERSASMLPQDHKPSIQEVQQALTRCGRPSWNEDDFQKLIQQLQYAGYGWLRPEGVRKQLEHMARAWQGPPSLPK
jgi:hypothetical protein